jgi:hypothetical protein
MSKPYHKPYLSPLLDVAIHFGDLQADRIIFLTNQLRDVRRAMWHAIALLKKGRADDARRVLEAELICDRGQH